MKAIVSHRLFWPLFILVALLVATRLKSPIFFDIRVVNGNLYGSLIDILRRTAPTLLVALGMTLVIATRGIDLSVGAVAAIAGAAAADVHRLVGAPRSRWSPCSSRVGIALLLSAAGGVWNGFLVAVLGIQPIVATLVLMTAGRGVAQLITDEQIITANSRPYNMIGGGYWLGRAVLDPPRRRHLAAHRAADPPDRARHADRVGRRQPGGVSRLAGVPARSITWTVYIVCAVFAGLAGLMITSNATAADPNSTGLFIELDAILAVVIGGTSLAGGRFSLAGTLIGAFIIQTMTTMILILGHRRRRSRSCSRRASWPPCASSSRPRPRRSRRAVRGDRRTGAAAIAPADRRLVADARRRPLRRHRARRRRQLRATDRHDRTALSAAAVDRSWGRYVPVMATGVAAARGDRHRRAALRQLRHRPGAGQHADQQLPPHRARRRHDVRDPHRRHRPVGRRRRRAVGDDRGRADGRPAGRRPWRSRSCCSPGRCSGCWSG